MDNNRIIAVVVGVVSFIIFLFLAKNKRTRFIMAVSGGLFIGVFTFLLLNGQSLFELDLQKNEDITLLLTVLISAVLAGTIFVNDWFNYPIVHYASLFALLVFSVLVADIIFPGERFIDLRNGIALEILAGGFSTFLIFLTIDSFNDQDADERHLELLKQVNERHAVLLDQAEKQHTSLLDRINVLQRHIDRLDFQNKKTLHGRGSEKESNL